MLSLGAYCWPIFTVGVFLILGIFVVLDAGPDPDGLLDLDVPDSPPCDDPTCPCVKTGDLSSFRFECDRADDVDEWGSDDAA